MKQLEMLTPRQLAQLAGIQVRTVTRLASVGEIPAVRVGRQWRFIKADIEEWLRTKAKNTRRRVLVVDDDMELLRFVTSILDRIGCDVLTASDGLKAIELLKTDSDFDLLILDLLLPIFDGPEVMSWMHRRRIGIDVIILTAYPESALMQRALTFRHVTVIRKPAEARTIQRAVIAVLDGAEAAQAAFPD